MKFSSLAARALPAAFALLAAAPAMAVGPTSEYYLSQYGGDIFVVQGASVVRSWSPTDNSGLQQSEIAVSGNVHTTSFGTYNNTAGNGVAYSPTGTVVGGPYPYAARPYQYDQHYDAASDGVHNYEASDQNEVVRTDANFQSPSLLFTTGTNTFFAGVAYDRSTNSLWLAGYSGGFFNYAMDGTLISSFTTSDGHSHSALGYDPADGTLWVSADQTSTLLQFSTTGTLLQTFTPSGLPGGSYLSGDFDSAPVPEPATLSLFGLAVLGLSRLRRRS